MSAYLPLIDENFVVESVATFLTTRGFVIEQRLTTTEAGVDIRAKQPSSGEIWLVEAKGQTSSKSNSRRHGKPFTGSQISVHVAMAFYAAATLRQLHPDRRTVRVGVALPEDAAHRRRVAAIRQILDTVGIKVLWVFANGKVSLANHVPSKPPSHEHQINRCGVCA